MKNCFGSSKRRLIFNNLVTFLYGVEVHIDLSIYISSSARSGDVYFEELVKAERGGEEEKKKKKRGKERKGKKKKKRAAAVPLYPPSAVMNAALRRCPPPQPRLSQGHLSSPDLRADPSSRSRPLPEEPQTFGRVVPGPRRPTRAAPEDRDRTRGAEPGGGGAGSRGAPGQPRPSPTAGSAVPEPRREIPGAVIVVK